MWEEGRGLQVREGRVRMIEGMKEGKERTMFLVNFGVSWTSCQLSFQVSISVILCSQCQSITHYRSIFKKKKSLLVR